MTMGADCKLYVNSGTFGTPDFSSGEVKNASGVKTTAERANAKKSGRGATFHTYDVSPIQDCKIEFTLKHENGNTLQGTFETAYQANTTVLVAALDGPSGTSGSAGLHGEFKVSKWSRNEPDEDTVEIEVELLPVDEDALEWLEVS